MPNRLVFWGIILAACAGFLLSGCGPGDTDIAATFESQVAARVAATLTAVPAATAYETQVPLITATPRQTSTSYPTATFYPTATPYATPTLFPTDTPEPTATAMDTPEVLSSPSIVQSPTAPPDTAGQFFQLMVSAKDQLGQYIGLIDTATVEDGAVNCQAAVSLYDRIISLPPPNAADSAAAHNAYGLYQAAMEIFKTTNGGIIEDCRSRLTSEGGGGIVGTGWTYQRAQAARVYDMLNLAVEELRFNQ